MRMRHKSLDSVDALNCYKQERRIAQFNLSTPCISQQTLLYWEVPVFREGQSQPSTSWKETVRLHQLACKAAEAAAHSCQTVQAWPNAVTYRHRLNHRHAIYVGKF